MSRLKSLLIPTLILVFALASAGYSQGQKRALPPRPAMQTAKITAINAGTGTLTVQGYGRGKRTTEKQLFVGSTTAIKAAGGAAITVSDLKVGDTIRVRGKLDGQGIDAKQIRVMKPRRG